MDPFDVFDSGRMTIAQDPTGAVFGVWQAGKHHGAQLANEPGTLSGTSARPRRRAAEEFYKAVFGYRVDQIDMGEEQPFRLFKVDGRGIGGIREPVAGQPPSWSVTFAVADAEVRDGIACQAARRHSADGAVRPPGDRRLGVIQDPAGAVFQVMKPDGDPPPPPS